MAIEILNAELQQRDIVPPEFLDSVLLRETYSPTAFGHRFAVPHSMEFLGRLTKLAVLIPKGPIRWGEFEVSMVLMLAINGDDYDDFIRFYQPLINLLYAPALFAELRRATTFDAFRGFLLAELQAE